VCNLSIASEDITNQTYCRQENERNNTRILTTALISEDRLCFYPMAAGKKCGVQQKLLMGRVRSLLHTDTQQQAPPTQPPPPFHVVSGSWCSCALEDSRILHTAIALAAPIVKTFLLKDQWQLLWLLTIPCTRRACEVKPNSNPLFERAKWTQMHSRSSIQSGKTLYSPIEHHGGEVGVLSAVLRRITSSYNLSFWSYY